MPNLKETMEFPKPDVFKKLAEAFYEATKPGTVSLYQGNEDKARTAAYKVVDDEIASVFSADELRLIASEPETITEGFKEKFAFLKEKVFSEKNFELLGCQDTGECKKN